MLNNLPNFSIGVNLSNCVFSATAITDSNEMASACGSALQPVQSPHCLSYYSSFLWFLASPSRPAPPAPTKPNPPAAPHPSSLQSPPAQLLHLLLPPRSLGAAKQLGKKSKHIHHIHHSG